MSTTTKFRDWRGALKRLEGAYAPATIRCYLGDVSRFEEWCAGRGLAIVPASPEAICGYLAAMQAHGHAMSTIQRSYYAISRVHQLMGLDDPTKHEEVRLALRRVRRALPARTRQAKALTNDYLKRFLEVQPETPWGLRNRAMISLGYDVLARRSELVALRLEDLSWRTDGTLQVLIRRGKTDPFGEGRIAFTSRRTGTLVDAWLDWRGSDINWLFCPIYKGHAINRGLNDSFIRNLIKSSAQAAGLGDNIVAEFSGHSMRVGAAQDLLAAGHSAAAIMRAGGWKNYRVLARYLETAEQNVWEGNC